VDDHVGFLLVVQLFDAGVIHQIIFGKIAMETFLQPSRLRRFIKWVPKKSFAAGHRDPLSVRQFSILIPFFFIK